MTDKNKLSELKYNVNRNVKKCATHFGIDKARNNKNPSTQGNSEVEGDKTLREEFDAILQRHSKTLWKLVDK